MLMCTIRLAFSTNFYPSHFSICILMEEESRKVHAGVLMEFDNLVSTETLIEVSCFLFILSRYAGPKGLSNQPQ